MAKSRNTYLDEGVQRLLDGTALMDKVGITLQLVTIGPGGFPHAALLSVGEVVAQDRHRMRLALWASSQTTGNLRQHSVALLTLVLAGTYHIIQLSARPCEGSESGLPGLAAFDAEVVLVERDQVPYAQLTSGITYRLNDPSTVLARWERTVRALRALPDRLAYPRGQP